MENKILASVFILVTVVCASLIYVFMINPMDDEKLTEVYLLDVNGLEFDEPIELMVGDEGEALLRIVNHEHENTTYYFKVTFNGIRLHYEHVFVVENEIWEDIITFKAREKGENQALEINLFSSSS